jgi:hypothetical protein
MGFIVIFFEKSRHRWLWSLFLALKAVKDLFGDIIRDITVALYQLSCTVFRCYKRERKHE